MSIPCLELTLELSIKDQAGSIDNAKGIPLGLTRI